MWITKYNANGNDFLIFHTFKKANYAKLAKKLCARHSGIGADGLVVVLPNKNFAYEWDFYNSDGSKAKMCGNASRCVGHYAYCNNLSTNKHSFLSGAGEISLEVSGNIVETNFGQVKILQKDIKENGLNFTLMDSGVPHLTAFVDSQDKIPTIKNTFLETMRNNYNANINIAYIKNKNTIILASYERGVEDITLACGTGMASVFYLALVQKKIKNKAVLIPPSKDKLYFRIKDDEVYYKGEVSKVGDVFIDLLNLMQ